MVSSNPVIEDSAKVTMDGSSSILGVSIPPRTSNIPPTKRSAQSPTEGRGDEKRGRTVTGGRQGGEPEVEVGGAVAVVYDGDSESVDADLHVGEGGMDGSDYEAEVTGEEPVVMTRELAPEERAMVCPLHTLVTA